MQHCERCRREAPPVESDAFLEWEAIERTGPGAEIGAICPGCITGLDDQAMYEQVADL